MGAGGLLSHDALVLKTSREVVNRILIFDLDSSLVEQLRWRLACDGTWFRYFAVNWLFLEGSRQALNMERNICPAEGTLFSGCCMERPGLSTLQESILTSPVRQSTCLVQISLLSCPLLPFRFWSEVSCLGYQTYQTTWAYCVGRLDAMSLFAIVSPNDTSARMRQNDDQMSNPRLFVDNGKIGGRMLFGNGQAYF